MNNEHAAADRPSQQRKWIAVIEGQNSRARLATEPRPALHTITKVVTIFQQGKRIKPIFRFEKSAHRKASTAFSLPSSSPDDRNKIIRMDVRSFQRVRRSGLKLYCQPPMVVTSWIGR